MGYFGLVSEKKYWEEDKIFREFALEILPEQNSKLYNYGLLDLGQKICNARKPDCNQCGLGLQCDFYSKQQ